ncbi:MAG: phytanoyl-CoA dioxygenase family protein [Pseudomonadales bacterium]|nr:phytanoyl-CoA dioxygenase family protein [Pseudomonadales bacterium]MDG1441565.1 phytanoyl-CoA dioxygenase family protein [Pseudomonadales bacterium]
MNKDRFTHAHVEQWRQEGFVIIPDFFTAQEIAPIVTDYERMYGKKGAGDFAGTELNLKQEDGVGEFRNNQFKNIDILPYEGSVEMNLISLHPALIEFAKQVLSTDEVHLYQSHTWAKYTGEADYDQAHHCDFSNHTLTVPADSPSQRSVDIVIYYTDVTDAHGALHYVTKTDASEVLRDGAIWAPEPEQQIQLRSKERSAAGTAGTLVAHSIDTFHRGTNLTLPQGYRYTMTVGYKAAGNDMIGYSTWQDSAEKPWDNIFNNATPQQLQCLGIPKPGDAFWSQRTLKLTQARWPNWDMQPYFDAVN